ncbi:MAG: glycosyltransferase [Bacteroidales bacterium]|nr:glycosyltransferase [Bacteroidales bacterium]
MRKLFLVVPCFNEAEVLPVSVPRMLEVLDSLETAGGAELETAVILADDGSTDSTREVIETFRDGRIRHLPLPHSGQQGTLIGGIRSALEQGADVIITLDADLQDDPAAIPEMVDKWQKGKDVVYGVRSARKGDSAFKKATAWLFYELMHLWDRRRIRGHADFRLMSRRCAEMLLEKASTTHDLLRNIVPTLGLEHDLVFYERGERSEGESKYGLPQMLKLGWSGVVSQESFWIILSCLITFVAFFLTSVDSPMHDSMVAHGKYIRHDSAWYFMAGKAWMNGLIPYVDFSDSKGPLLWLFYAVAYLISPRSWIGVFWINALAYVATTAILFKASMTITDSPRKSALICAILNIFYFIPFMIFDDKAEAIALPFVALSMLMACRSLYGKGGSFFLWGLAFGAIILIKYNIAAMTVIFFIAMAVCLGSWKEFFRATGSAIAGFLVPTLPIMAYLLWVGAADDFIKEYFSVTFTTIGNILGSNDKGEFLKTKIIAYMSVAAVGAVTAAFALKKRKWFPPVALVWFLLCLSRYARTYYFIPVNVLMVFTIFGAIRCFEKDFGFRRFVFGPLLAAAVIFLGVNDWRSYRKDYFYGREKNLHRERAEAMVRLVAREHNPRVLYWGCGDRGFGIEAEDLPACKYWAIQAGATPEMKSVQEETAREGKADFIFVNTYDWRRQKKLREYGYYRCMDPEFGPYRAYSRRPD